MSLQTSIIDIENRMIALSARVNSLQRDSQRPPRDERPPQNGPTVADLERELGVVKSDVATVKDMIGATDAAIDAVKSSIKKHCAILETSIVQRFEKRYAEMMEKHAAALSPPETAPAVSSPLAAPAEPESAAARNNAAAAAPALDSQDDDALVLNPTKAASKRKRDKQRKSE